MSKIKDNLIDMEIKDTYKEHSIHSTYQDDCSECYRNILEFDTSGSEEDLKEVEEIVNQKFNCDKCKDTGIIKKEEWFGTDDYCEIDIKCNCI